MLSRNFKLQAVGDLAWLREYYEFDSIAFAVDELVVLDVGRRSRDGAAFAALLRELSRHCFMPIAAGGGVRSVEDARRLLDSGADKIVVNSPLFTAPELVRELVARFGAQCVIASLDYRRVQKGGDRVFIENGERELALTLREAVEAVVALNVGELYLTSMERDGTGQGLDLAYVADIVRDCRLPVIVSGGAGNFQHLCEAIAHPVISAVSTANLFNFMSDNLREARNEIIASGVALANWPPLETSATW